MKKLLYIFLFLSPSILFSQGNTEAIRIKIEALENEAHQEFDLGNYKEAESYYFQAIPS